MEIILTASGTRGDVQPALALAIGLRSAGHRVRLMAGSNFESWIRTHGFDCIPILDMEALMRSEDGVKWAEQGNNPMAQLRIMRKLLNDNAAEIIGPILQHAGECDLHITGFTSTAMVAAAASRYGVPVIESALQPYRPTRSGAAAIASVVRGESFLNLLAGKLGQRFICSMVRDVVGTIRQQLGLPEAKAGDVIARLNGTPLVNGYSEHVVPHPTDWTPASATVGYWFLDESADWTPPESLTSFIGGGPAPVYIGFGSMSSANPRASFDLACEAVRKAGQRAVFVSGWSGLTRSDVPDNVVIADKVPHTWLFQHVSAVVHHGGAGTTAAGLRAGKPTLIIPHMADQPFWGRRVYELGLGPKPILRPRLTVDALAESIRSLVTDSGMRRAAEACGQNIASEDGVARGVEVIERFYRNGVRHG